jgi:integrase
VTQKAVAAVLDACPDDEWRAIISLCRFAGLRCPSELVGLTWGEVNWERSRLTVRSPKTQDHGEAHAVRMVPIGPELRPILQDLFDAAEPGTPGAQWIIPRLRDPSMNLRTTFEKIIARTGVQPWPRLFHNLRGSCATDWCERFPAHVVAGWMGHSPTIAAKHYLSTRDAHFDLAAGVGEAAGSSCQMATATNPATQAPRTDTKPAEGHPKNNEKPPVLAGVGAGCDSVESGQVPPEGLEPSTR